MNLNNYNLSIKSVTNKRLYDIIDDRIEDFEFNEISLPDEATIGTINTKLTFNDNSNITSTNRLLLPNGTPSAPSLSFSSNTNTGLYLPSSGVIRLKTDGNEALTINEATANFKGNVLIEDGNYIGTTGTRMTFDNNTSITIDDALIVQSPIQGAKLTINSGQTVGADSTNFTFNNLNDVELNGGVLSVLGGDPLEPSYTFQGDKDTGIYTSGSDALGFSTGGINALTLNNNQDASFGGNINVNDAATIGTTNTTLTFNDNSNITINDPLFIPDGTASTPAICFSNDAGTNTGIYASGENAMNFTAAGSSRLQLTTSKASFTEDIELESGNSIGTTNTTLTFVDDDRIIASHDIIADARIGINTSSPSSYLHIQGPNTGTNDPREEIMIRMGHPFQSGVKEPCSAYFVLRDISGGSNSIPALDFNLERNQSGSTYDTTDTALTIIARKGASFIEPSVGINQKAPDESAVLDIVSTNQGVLLPRMNNTQRDNIDSPATGLMIFSTDNNRLEFYNGTNWKFLDSTVV